MITQLQNATPSLQGLANAISSALGISGSQLADDPARHGHFLDGHPGPEPRGDAGSSNPASRSRSTSHPWASAAVSGRSTISAGGSVSVTVGGNAELDFGFDLTNPGVFLLDTTQVRSDRRDQRDQRFLSPRASAPSGSWSGPMRRSHSPTWPANRPGRREHHDGCPRAGQSDSNRSALDEQLPVQRDRRPVQRVFASHRFRSKRRRSHRQHPQSPGSYEHQRSFRPQAWTGYSRAQTSTPRCSPPGSKLS